MLKVIVELEGTPNGYENCLKVVHDGKVIREEHDRMKVQKDLNWIKEAIEEAYQLGIQDTARRFSEGLFGE